LHLGAGVEGFAVGDQVVYGLPTLGAYCQERIYPDQPQLIGPI
jgi:NADPH:quinone reductase-like Zn-dependent oxidoreductase